MSYNVLAIPPFNRQLKRLAKKYPSLKKEYERLVEDLEKNPLVQGDSIGNDCYKIRLAISSKRKEKSGGARVIIHAVLSDKNVFLLSIYDKSEKENISVKELNILLKEIPQ